MRRAPRLANSYTAVVRAGQVEHGAIGHHQPGDYEDRRQHGHCASVVREGNHAEDDVGMRLDADRPDVGDRAGGGAGISVGMGIVEREGEPRHDIEVMSAHRSCGSATAEPR